MLVGGKKLKWEVFTRFSFISAYIFPFENSVVGHGHVREMWWFLLMSWWGILSDVERNQAKLPLMVSIIMGLQHSLAMLGGIITPPSLIAGLKETYHCLLADVKLFLKQISWIFVAISLFFGTLEVSTPHTTQLLKDKEMKLIYWQLFKKYWHVLLFGEGPPSGDACFSNPEEELCKSRQWFTWVKARCWDVSIMRLGVPSSIESQHLRLRGKLGFWNSLYSFV